MNNLQFFQLISNISQIDVCMNNENLADFKDFEIKVNNFRIYSDFSAFETCLIDNGDELTPPDIIAENIEVFDMENTVFDGEDELTLSENQKQKLIETITNNIYSTNI